MGIDGLDNLKPDTPPAPKPDYECCRCGELIQGNPRQCPSCGYTVYKIYKAVPTKES